MFLIEADNPLFLFLCFPCRFLENSAEQLKRMKKIKLYFLRAGKGAANFFLLDQERKEPCFFQVTLKSEIL